MVSFTEAQVAGWLAALLWPFIRVLALFTTAPILSMAGIPDRVKVGLAFLIALAAQPAVPAVQTTAEIFSVGGAMIVAQQVLIGATIGFTVRLMFAAFDLAGELIGLQMGLNFAGFFDPQSGGTGTAVTTYMSTVTSLLFIALNGHLLMLHAVTMSFEVFPVSDDVLGFLRQASPLQWGKSLFQLALLVALPVLALVLFLNVVLGVISRVAPQFNIFAVGFPATIGLGLIGLAAGLPLIEQPVTQAIEEVLRAFGG
jgi:flagellar biosynthetic protein FliR